MSTAIEISHNAGNANLLQQFPHALTEDDLLLCRGNGKLFVESCGEVDFNLVERIVVLESSLPPPASRQRSEQVELTPVPEDQQSVELITDGRPRFIELLLGRARIFRELGRWQIAIP